MSTFVYKYGGHSHEVGEIIDFVWEKECHHTKRGRRDTSTLRATLKGQLLGCTYQEIRTAITALEKAYAYNGMKFVLSNPDGTDSAYVMDPTDPLMLVPPRIASISFPNGTREEMVATREFVIVLECVRKDVESEIIEYYEEIRHVGMTGAHWVFAQTLTGVVPYQVWVSGTQRIIQDGYSVGMQGYYLAGATPILGPAYEHVDCRVETLGKPLHLGNSFVYYPAKWHYEFETSVPMLLMPP
jgi:hypothetical protein